MYTFVFLWTPALNPHTYVAAAGPAPDPLAGGDAGMPRRTLLSAGAVNSGEPAMPHGLVFAIFMTASMVGTALAGRLMAKWRLEAVLQVGSVSGAGGSRTVRSYAVSRTMLSEMTLDARLVRDSDAADTLFLVQPAASCQGVFWAGAVLLFVPVMYHTRLADHALPADVLEGEQHTFEMQRLAHAAGEGSSRGGSTVGQLSVHPGAAGAGGTSQLDVGGRVQLLAFCGFEVSLGRV